MCSSRHRRTHGFTSRSLSPASWRPDFRPRTARWDEFISPFHVLPSNAEVAWEYGRAYRFLQGNRMLIGANDLWIAATGLAYRMPIVTRNVELYRRAPDLQVITYRS